MRQYGPARSKDFTFSPRKNSAAKVAWRNWNDVAFAEAEDRDRPIFLMITTSWSDRSHLFDETTLSDKRVISCLNKHYLPIRVDAERRPDISDRYAQKGWPSIAFLTPAGDIIALRNTVSPKNFLGLAEQIYRLYTQRNRELGFAAQSAKRSLISDEFKARSLKTLDYNFPSMASSLVANRLHDYLNSPGRSGKLSMPEIELLLRYARSHRAELLDIACKYLDRLFDSCAVDQRHGGFLESNANHRLRTFALRMNADLIRNALLAYQLNRKHKYHKAAFESLAFVGKHLAIGRKGGFFSSAQIQPVGPQARSSLKISRLDRTVIVDSNCRMVDTYLSAFEINGNLDYLSYALATLDYLWSIGLDPKTGMAHYIDGDIPHLFGGLDDQAWAIYVFARAGAITSERGYTIRAIEILDIAKEHLFDDEIFFDGPSNPAAPGLLKMRLRPLYGNTAMARALSLLTTVTRDPQYLRLAQSILRSLKTDSVSIQEMAEYALAIMKVGPESTKPRKAA